MLISWLDASKVKEFGLEMAEILSQRNSSDAQAKHQNKSIKKNEKRHEATFLLIEKKLTEFKKSNRLNIYTKAQLGSAFKYALLDKGFDQEFSEKTTTWLLLKCK